MIKTQKCKPGFNLSAFELGFINYLNGTFSFQIWVYKLLNAILKSLEVSNFEMDVGNFAGNFEIDVGETGN